MFEFNGRTSYVKFGYMDIDTPLKSPNGNMADGSTTGATKLKVKYSMVMTYERETGTVL